MIQATISDIMKPEIKDNDKIVRICHKKGKVVEQNNDGSYIVSIELGGVLQHITVTKEFVEAWFLLSDSFVTR